MNNKKEFLQARRPHVRR